MKIKIKKGCGLEAPGRWLAVLDIVVEESLG